MKNTYIQFDEPENNNQTSQDGLLKKLLQKVVKGILTTIIPNANPDFDNEIDNVKTWLVEIENETGIPEREIGLNKEGNVILKMPYKNNYGYWTDNNLILDDFVKIFKAKEIDKATFERKWDLISETKQQFDFFKTEMPTSRNADFYLGCLDGCIFMDFNLTSDNRISLCRISFDGYGCCELTKKTNLLDLELSTKFLEEIKKDDLNQEKLTPIILEIININKKYIWTDAIQEYNLIEKQI